MSRMPRLLLTFACGVGIASAAHAQPQGTSQGTTACYPECRMGFLCSPEGQCVSACNPGCGSNAQCVGPGQCAPLSAHAPIQPVAGPRGVPVRGAGHAGAGHEAYPHGYALQPPQFQLEARSPGWARGAGIYGLIAAAVTGITGGVAIAIDETETSLPIGAGATLLASISAPIVSLGGGSARSHSQVTGSVGLRVLGWVTYGLGITSAAVILIVGTSEEIEPSYSIPTLLLVVTSLVSFSIDALASAGQAADVSVGQNMQLVPTVTVVPDGRGGVHPTVGLAGQF